MRLFAMVAFALAFFGCIAQPNALPIVVHNDPGGDVDWRDKQIRTLLQHGRSVVIDGWCASACTMYLNLPPGQVCVTRRSKLLFHAVRLEAPGHPVDRRMTARLWQQYPASVQQWLSSRGARPGSGREYLMKGSDLVGRVPLCRAGG